jgi:hypothetical protein
MRQRGCSSLFPPQQFAVDVPNLVAYLSHRPILERFVIWCSSKIGYLKDMHLKEIGLRAQTMITIIGSIANNIGGIQLTIL